MAETPSWVADLMALEAKADAQSPLSVADYITTLEEAQNQAALAYPDTYQQESIPVGQMWVDANAYQQLADADIESSALIYDMLNNEREDVSGLARGALTDVIKRGENPLAPYSDAQVQDFLDDPSTIPDFDAATMLKDLSTTLESAYAKITKSEDYQKAQTEAQTAADTAKRQEEQKLYSQAQMKVFKGQMEGLAKMTGRGITGLDMDELRPQGGTAALISGAKDTSGGLIGLDMSSLRKTYPEVPSEAFSGKTNLESAMEKLQGIVDFENLVKDWSAQSGEIQNKLTVANKQIDDALMNVFYETGLTKLGEAKIQMYYGQWLTNARNNLDAQGRQAVDQGVYNKPLSLPVPMMRQWFDIGFNYPEVGGILGQTGMMDVATKFQQLDLENSNRLVGYVADRTMQAKGSVLAYDATVQNVDLRSIWQQAYGAEASRVASIKQPQIEQESSQALGIQNEVEPNFDNIVWNFQEGATRILLGDTKGPTSKTWNTGLNVTGLPTFQRSKPQEGIGGGPPAQQGWTAYFDPRNTMGGNEASPEELLRKPKEEEEPRTQPRRLVFPNSRYTRRLY